MKEDEDRDARCEERERTETEQRIGYAAQNIMVTTMQTAAVCIKEAELKGLAVLSREAAEILHGAGAETAE